MTSTYTPKGIVDMMTALAVSYTLDYEPTMSYEEYMEWFLHTGGDVWDEY